jgi:hypothetical protein
MVRSGEESIMTQSFFARQLGIYASYHRDERNRATHSSAFRQSCFRSWSRSL